MRQSFPRIFVITFFILYFLLGIFIFRDYGISWDEHRNLMNGVIALNYVSSGDDSLLSYDDRYYGTAFELPLAAVGSWLGIETPQTVFYLRHLATFLFFFLGVVFFYKLCCSRFGHWGWGILGATFLILSPRIFADSFYNSKDIVSLAAFTVGSCTLFWFLENPSLIKGLIHAIASAFLIDVRLSGLVIPLLTIGVATLDIIFIQPKRALWRHSWPLLLLYSALLAGFIILFWPYLWSNPIGNFIEAFQKMGSFSASEIATLYLGEYIAAIDVPWHYIPVWAGITTPVLYLLLFGLGLGSLLVRSTKNLRRGLAATYEKHRPDLIFLAWLFLPWLVIVILSPELYDGWRHFYFIFPAFLLIALLGVQELRNLLARVWKGKKSHFVWIGLGTLLVFGLLKPIWFMVKYHPYQNLYFNFLAGGMQKAKQNFELDYWGLSFKEGLEYIATQDKSPEIPVFFAHGNIGAIDILKDEDNRRFLPIPDTEDAKFAKYVLSNYRWHKDEYPNNLNEIYSVKIDGVKVMSVFRIY